MGTWGPHQWSVETWRLHVHGAKSYFRFRVNLELDSFWVKYDFVRFWVKNDFEHVFLKPPTAWARCVM